MRWLEVRSFLSTRSLGTSALTQTFNKDTENKAAHWHPLHCGRAQSLAGDMTQTLFLSSRTFRQREQNELRSLLIASGCHLFRTTRTCWKYTCHQSHQFDHWRAFAGDNHQTCASSSIEEWHQYRTHGSRKSSKKGVWNLL